MKARSIRDRHQRIAPSWGKVGGSCGGGAEQFGKWSVGARERTYQSKKGKPAVEAKIRRWELVEIADHDRGAIVCNQGPLGSIKKTYL